MSATTHRWTIMHRTDWGHDHDSLLPPRAPIPDQDECLRVIDVVPVEQLQGAVSFTDDELQCLTCAMAGNFPERFESLRAGLLRKLFKAYPYAGGSRS